MSRGGRGARAGRFVNTGVTSAARVPFLVRACHSGQQQQQARMAKRVHDRLFVGLAQFEHVPRFFGAQPRIFCCGSGKRGSLSDDFLCCAVIIGT